MSAFSHPIAQSVYVVVLRKDLPSPLAPESDEEKVADTAKEGAKSEAAASGKPAEQESTKPDDKKPPEVKIDVDGISNRILALPIPARSYNRLMAGKPGILFLLESLTGSPGTGGGLTLHKFETKTRKTDKILDGIGFFNLSANAEKMLIRQGSRWFIASASQPIKPDEGTLKLDGLEVRVDPKVEWRQMFREAWRIQTRKFSLPSRAKRVAVRGTSRYFGPVR